MNPSSKPIPPAANLWMLLSACLLVSAGRSAAQIPDGPEKADAEERIRLDPHNLFQVSSKQAFPLTLPEAVRLAVENNLDIAVAAFDPLIRRTEEDLALTVFDPLYFANFNLQDSETATASSLAGASTLVQRTTSFNTGIRKTLFTGGSYELGFDVTRNRTNSQFFASLNPTFSSHLTASASQPLLRGLGVRRNLSGWKRARNATISAQSGDSQTAARTAHDVEIAYWNLVFAHGDLEVKRLSLRRANKLLEENRQRALVGQITEIDVISAEVDVARREEDRIVAEEAVKNAGDLLKFLIRPLDQEFLEGYDLVPTTLPEGRLPEFRYLESLRYALANRWELTRSRIDLQNRDILVEDAQHDLLPLLDVTASVALNALNNHLDTVVSDLDNGDFQDWSLGINFEVPIGNRSARAALRRAQLEMKQALVSHRALEEGVIQEVRRAFRSAATEALRLGAAEKANELAERQLEKEGARYQEGLSTAFQVLDFQEDLASAESNELLARINFQKAMVALDLATTRILDRFGIVRAPDPEATEPVEPPAVDWSRFGDLIDPPGR